MKISLKAARVNAEMTQLEAANAIGVSRDAILAWENGKTSPKIERVVQLCHLMHRIPILGSISAGLPLYAEQNIEGYTYTDLNSNGEYFALRVRGDSMNAIQPNY